MNALLDEMGHKRQHHRNKGNKPGGGHHVMPDHPSYRYTGDGSDLSGTPTSPLLRMNKPNFDKKAAEKYLRTHIMDVLLPETESEQLIHVHPQLQTTTALKLVMKGTRLAQAEQDKAQREREKTKKEEVAKADAMKKLLSSVAKHKMDTRMDKRHLLVPQLPPSMLGQAADELEGEEAEERMWTVEEETGPSHSYWDSVGVGEDEDESYYGPREEQYDNVYTDVAQPRPAEARDPNKPPARMYNVQLQVQPKDLAQIYSTAPWRRNRPKMYDVGLSVGPKDWDQIRPKSCWDRAPGYDDDHVQPEEEEEEEEMELERKPSKRADASVLARPLGYRELRLSISMDAITVEAEVQVNEIDIEKALAAQRGIILTDDNILWPSNREFRPDTFELKIERYVDQCWKLEGGWMYSIKYLQQHTTNYRNKYIFQVLFSMPTPTNPVPLATASVYFVVEIGHYAHLDEQVKVHYCVEGMRYAHSPGHLPFQTKWLTSTIHDKIRVQKAWNAELEFGDNLSTASGTLL